MCTPLTNACDETGLRYFVPLLLFPFSDAPPAFTLLFILSLVLLSRPCAYCSVLLVAMALASCSFDNRCLISFNHGNLFSAINRTASPANVTLNTTAIIPTVTTVENTTLFDRATDKFASIATVFAQYVSPVVVTRSPPSPPPLHSSTTAPSPPNFPLVVRIANWDYFKAELDHVRKYSGVQQISRGLYEVSVVGVSFRLKLFGY